MKTIPTTHELQMESYTEPYRAPEPQQPETPKSKVTRDAIAQLRAEIEKLTAELEELEANEATLAIAKSALGGTN